MACGLLADDAGEPQRTVGAGVVTKLVPEAVKYFRLMPEVLAKITTTDKLVQSRRGTLGL